MTIFQAFFLKQACIPRRILAGNIILLGRVSLILNTAAHQLLYLAVMNVNTGS